MLILAEDSMRASDSANPPQNMHRAMIFQGVFVCALVFATSVLRGEQKRRRVDEHHAQVAREAKEQIDMTPSTALSP